MFKVLPVGVTLRAPSADQPSLNLGACHDALQRRLTPRLPSPRFFSRVPSPRCCSLARFPSLWASSAMASSAMRGGLGPTAAASVPKEDDELEVGLCLGSKKQQPPSPASCLILTTRDLQPGPLSPDSSVSSSSPAAPPPPPRREQWLSDTHRGDSLHGITFLASVQHQLQARIFPSSLSCFFNVSYIYI
jgi:hypothetical protein